LVSITNDAWFGRDSTGPLQHYEMARYRSIEEGLPMARAASGGVSAIVDSFGREVRGTHRQGGAVEAQLPPALSSTLLSRWGGTFLGILLVICMFLRFFPARLLGRK
jgi:apolipoprotein N-acyltransferase